MQPAKRCILSKSEYFFRAASDIEFCVIAFDSSRGVSDKPQTMSGLLVPLVAPQMNIKPREPNPAVICY